MFYDKFKMTLDDVQVMLFDKGKLYVCVAPAAAG